MGSGTDDNRRRGVIVARQSRPGVFSWIGYRLLIGARSGHVDGGHLRRLVTRLCGVAASCHRPVATRIGTAACCRGLTSALAIVLCLAWQQLLADPGQSLLDRDGRYQQETLDSMTHEDLRSLPQPRPSIAAPGRADTTDRLDSRANDWRTGPSRQTMPQGNATTASVQRDIAILWTRARRALWQGRHSEAERAYLDLVQRLPTEPDPIGELGNFYTLLGQYTLAERAYADTVKRLLEQGRTWEAGQLVRTLHVQGVVAIDTALDVLQHHLTQPSPGTTAVHDSGQNSR